MNTRRATIALRTAVLPLIWIGSLTWVAGDAAAQVVEDGFVPLFDGTSLDGWVVENSDGENFSVQDGALRVEEPQGWLRTETTHEAFELKLDVRFLTDGADSGVFFRAPATGTFARGWPTNAYQVQLRDMHEPSNFIGLGNLYRHGMPQGNTEYDEEAVLEVYRGVGEWHDLRVTVVDDRLTVTLEGTTITEADGIGREGAHLGFQGEIGTVEYRNIRIREL